LVDEATLVHTFFCVVQEVDRFGNVNVALDLEIHTVTASGKQLACIRVFHDLNGIDTVNSFEFADTDVCKWHCFGFWLMKMDVGYLPTQNLVGVKR